MKVYPIYSFRRFGWFYVPLLFLVLTLLLFYRILPGKWFYEVLYEPYLFSLVRNLLDHTFGLLPFNALFPVIFLVLFYLLFQLARMWRQRKEGGILIRQTYRILMVPIVIVTLFYWFWGFHYLREDLSSHLGLESLAVNEKRLTEEFKSTLGDLIQVREALGLDSIQSFSERYADGMVADTLLQEAGEHVFYELNLSLYGKPKVKKLYPKGFLHRINTSGFYNPITGECNVEADLHPLQIPFIMAHEWTHAQGITDEGDANFLAYWICVSSTDLIYRYSGYLSYWRYLLSESRKRFPELYEKMTKDVTTGIKKDLMEIRESNNKYPEFMPKARDAVYENYLKSHGISEGMNSYNRLVALVITYKREKKI